MYVIATDPGTITTIQGVGFSFQKPGSFHAPSRAVPPAPPDPTGPQARDGNVLPP